MKTIVITGLLFCHVHAVNAQLGNVAKAQIFAADLTFSDKLFRALPFMQRERLLSELEDRGVIVGKRDFFTGEIDLLQSAPAKTQHEYEQLVEEHYGKLDHLTSSVLLGDRQKAFRLQNLWKVNLNAIMPHTAALTQDDVIASVERHTRILGNVVQAGLDLAVLDYYHIVTASKNLDSEQLAAVLFRTQQSLALSDGKDKLIARFNEELRSRERNLKDQRRYISSRGFTKKPLTELPPYAGNAIREVARLEQSLARIEEVAAQAKPAEGLDTDMLAAFFAEEALAYLGDITILNYDVVTSDGANKIAVALVADLTLAGYALLSYLSAWDTTDKTLLAAVTAALETSAGQRAVFVE